MSNPLRGTVTVRKVSDEELKANYLKRTNKETVKAQVEEQPKVETDGTDKPASSRKTNKRKSKGKSETGDKEE